MTEDLVLGVAELQRIMQVCDCSLSNPIVMLLLWLLKA